MKKINFKMKQTLMSITVFFMFAVNLQAQQWKENLPKTKSEQELTFFDYQNAFNKYWADKNVKNGYYYENGQKKKAIGWKQFKRWEYQMEKQINPLTGAFPNTTAKEQFSKYYKNKPVPKSSNGNWTILGTNSSAGGYAGIGRLNCVAFHPTKTNTYWVGAPAGGIWLTTDNANSWTCLSNDNSVLGVSDIVIPSDYEVSNTIYIATGDRDAWVNNSVGVLKSTNGGTSWATTGLTYAASDNKMVNRLLLSPTDNNMIIAATSEGVYKTTDGGTTWNTQLTPIEFIDMEYKPGDFNTLYGTTKSGGIFTSINGGGTWTQKMDLAAGRVEIAISAAQPTWVYALVSASDYGLFGIYKSTNSGTTFTAIYQGTVKNLLGWEANGSDEGGQGWYDLAIAVSPTDANTLLVGGVNTWKSSNGGTDWTISNHWWGDGVQDVHADKHCLKYRSNGDLFECNDGGLYLSNNNGTDWTDKTNGLTISQMYKLGISETDKYEIITGLQDNGTKLLSAGEWGDVKGGDGMECLIDYSDVNVQYGTYTNGEIERTTDHWVSDLTIISENITGDNVGAWVTPYIIDPLNPQTIYAGYSDVWKTTDRGDNWVKISTMDTQDKIRSMAIATSNTNYLYVADQTNIWKTINGGTDWADITGTLPVYDGVITYITVKADDPLTAWVTISGYSSPGVYQTTDGGISWTDISSGLPTIPCNTVVQNKFNTSTNELYVGTDFGVYFKNGSNDWIFFNTYLPNIKIGELEIWYGESTSTSKLRAATYGRGLWESDLFYNESQTYTSSTATQNITSVVSPNSVNQQIIGVQIVMTGTKNPVNATSFSFNTIGTTNAITDILNAKLYFTGSSNTFATDTQFGTTTNSPNENFTITGTQALIEGTNYFWLTYDVSQTATLGNYIDAQCTSLTVGTAKIPTITNPSGKLQIGYCIASSITCDEYVSNVTIGTINNTTSCSSGGYTNYTGMVTNVTQGMSLDITVKNGNAIYENDKCGIWVDWNNNGDFTDDQAVSVMGTPGVGPYSATLNCPENAPVGNKRIRIRIDYNLETISSCGESTYGEVEDYTINVLPKPASLQISSISLSPFSDTEIQKTSIEQTFTVSGLDLVSDITITAPAGFQISKTSGSGYTNSVKLTPANGTISAVTLYTVFSPTQIKSYNGNISVSASTAVTKNISVSGNGITPTTPTIVLSANTLDFGTVYQGETPVVKSYIISSSVLSTNLEISSSSDFTISESSSSGFSNSLSITGSVNKTIYVKFTGTSVKTYSQAITHTSTGATSQTLAASAEVKVHTPAITVSGTSISFEDVVNGGTSTEQTFTVSGEFLSGAVSISAPAGFEISLTSGSGFAGTLSLTPPSGTIATTTIYARFKPAEAKDYTGVISVSATGVTTKEISLSGKAYESFAKISIVSPETKTNFDKNSKIQIETNVKLSADLKLSKIDFFANNELIGTIINTPYSLNWDTNGKTSGSYIVKAVLTTDKGTVANSEIEMWINEEFIIETNDFNFSIPESVSSTIPAADRVFTVTLINGNDLPEWLTFDEETLTFTGTAPAEAGTLKIRVTVSNGSSKEVIEYIFTLKYEGNSTIGIVDNTLKNISIYPNPANDYFYISWGNNTGIFNVKISDISGKILYSQKKHISENSKIEILTSSMQSGIYFIHISGKNFEKTEMINIIKD